MQDSNILIDPITTNGVSSSTAIGMSLIITNNNSYCASAPGKVILFGEHSVVYGQPAIAAALSDLRIYVHIQISTIQNTIPISNDSIDNRLIRICMPDLPQSIDVSFPIESFITIQDQLHSPPTKQCTDHIESFIQSYGPDSITNDKHSIHAILPVLYLLSQLAPNVHQLINCHITVRSKDLPVGAGLGSSAAFGVACTAAFIQWKYDNALATKTEMNDTNGNIQWPISCTQIPTPDMIQDINQYAYYSEMLLHGRPSGIDNTVSSHGGIISFTRSHHEVSFNPISLKSSSSTDGTNHHNNNPLHILLVDTHVPRQTKQLVANVRTLHDQFPTIITPILEAMGQIANTFCNIITTTTTTGTINDTTHINSILTLVRTNQSLLCALGVSHPSLDHICSIVNNEEFYHDAAAKLTGAGGGGCAMILLSLQPNHTSSKDIKNIQQDIITKIQTMSHTTEYQYTFLSSSVGGTGVLFVPIKEYETLFMS